MNQSQDKGIFVFEDGSHPGQSFLLPDFPPIRRCFPSRLASLLTQLVKNTPAMQETPVRFLGQEDLLEKGSATHSSVLGIAWC